MKNPKHEITATNENKHTPQRTAKEALKIIAQQFLRTTFIIDKDNYHNIFVGASLSRTLVIRTENEMKRPQQQTGDKHTDKRIGLCLCVCVCEL